MATKRSASKKTAPELPSQSDMIHRVGVLLEEVRGQQTLMIEAMSSMRESFDRRLDEGLARVEARLSVLEEVVRENSRDIRKNSEDIRKNSEDIRKNSEDIRKNSEDIEAMRIELRRLRVDFDSREERVKIEALEQRVTRLEQRLAG